MENFSLTHLSLVNSKKDILLDIPRDMYPFSVFGSGIKKGTNELLYTSVLSSTCIILRQTL